MGELYEGESQLMSQITPEIIDNYLITIFSLLQTDPLLAAEKLLPFKNGFTLQSRLEQRVIYNGLGYRSPNTPFVPVNDLIKRSSIWLDETSNDRLFYSYPFDQFSSVPDAILSSAKSGNENIMLFLHVLCFESLKGYIHLKHRIQKGKKNEGERYENEKPLEVDKITHEMLLSKNIQIPSLYSQIGIEKAQKYLDELYFKESSFLASYDVLIAPMPSQINENEKNTLWNTFVDIYNLVRQDAENSLQMQRSFFPSTNMLQKLIERHRIMMNQRTFFTNKIILYQDLLRKINTSNPNFI